MKTRPLGNSTLSASIVGLGMWVLGGGQIRVQDTDDAESIRKTLNLVINLNHRRVLGLLDSWKSLTGKNGCTLAQLVIAWTAARPGVTQVLCGTRNPTRLKDNARAGEMALAPEDSERIRRDVVNLGEPDKK